EHGSPVAAQAAGARPAPLPLRADRRLPGGGRHGCRGAGSPPPRQPDRHQRSGLGAVAVARRRHHQPRAARRAAGRHGPRRARDDRRIGELPAHAHARQPRRRLLRSGAGDPGRRAGRALPVVPQRRCGDLRPQLPRVRAAGRLLAAVPPGGAEHRVPRRGRPGTGHRDRPRAGDPRHVALTGGARAGPPVHQLLPRHASAVAALVLLLRDRARAARRHRPVHRGDHRARPERRRVLGGGVPGRDPVDRARAVRGRAVAGHEPCPHPAPGHPPAGGPPRRPADDQRVRDPHQGHLAGGRPRPHPVPAGAAGHRPRHLLADLQRHPAAGVGGRLSDRHAADDPLRHLARAPLPLRPDRDSGRL
ncbi:MAG: ABC transporter, permease protein (cluster 3, basic aa/glutamine/opines), partial [uncultured Solirubrobacteraceae bacterium]